MAKDATDNRASIFRSKGFLILCVIGFFAIGYMVGGGGDEAPAPDHIHESETTGQQASSDSEGDTIWTCSMHPQIQLPDPGQCPICFMDLIPLSKNADGDGEAISLRQIHLSSEARKLAEVVVTPVKRRAATLETRLLGKVDYDETRLGTITAWMSGRIDKLYVDFTGSVVKKGQPMAEIYSPELLTAQAELIQSVKTLREHQGSSLSRVKETARLTEQAAREKLRLLGLSKAQIDRVVERGTPSDHVTLYAPMGGVVIEKDVVEGMYVATGKRIYSIADLSKVWVILEAYESDLQWIKLEENVRFQAEALPGRVYKGEVVYIDPIVDPKTRTVRVRLEVDNTQGHLKPGMFVRAVYTRDRGGDDNPLVIPETAPLVTGKRAVVYLQVPDKSGTFVGREIVLGPKVGDSYVVKDGLEEGDLVVTKGNFKIDSAIQIQAKPSMMNELGAPSGGGHDHAKTHDSGSMDEMTAPDRASVPPEFAKALLALDQARIDLAQAVASGTLEDIKSAYNDFFAVLCGTDPKSLEGDAALKWNELSMLLGNDAMLGVEAEDSAEAKRLFATLTQHFNVLDATFGLETIKSGMALKAMVPDAFKSQLGGVFRAYSRLHEHLSKDDFTGARGDVRDIKQQVMQVKGDLLSARAAAVWHKAKAELSTGLAEAEGAADIDTLRGAFHTISTGLDLAISELGVAGETVFELFCPMAFNDQGAVWLQPDKEIRNPYFGAAMYGCGEVRQQIASPGSDKPLAMLPDQAVGPFEDMLVGYLALQRHLAEDAEQPAREVAAQISKALTGVDPAAFPGQGETVWKRGGDAVARGLEAIRTATDLEGLRLGFDLVSKGMIHLFESFMVDTSGPVYELNCPMAFDNRGASWLQRDQTVRNPYFGAAMYGCGEVVRQVN